MHHPHCKLRRRKPTPPCPARQRRPPEMMRSGFRDLRAMFRGGEHGAVRRVDHEQATGRWSASTTGKNEHALATMQHCRHRRRVASAPGVLRRPKQFARRDIKGGRVHRLPGNAAAELHDEPRAKDQPVWYRCRRSVPMSYSFSRSCIQRTSPGGQFVATEMTGDSKKVKTRPSVMTGLVREPVLTRTRLRDRALANPPAKSLAGSRVSKSTPRPRVSSRRRKSRAVPRRSPDPPKSTTLLDLPDHPRSLFRQIVKKMCLRRGCVVCRAEETRPVGILRVREQRQADGQHRFDAEQLRHDWARMTSNFVSADPSHGDGICARPWGARGPEAPRTRQSHRTILAYSFSKRSPIKQSVSRPRKFGYFLVNRPKLNPCRRKHRRTASAWFRSRRSRFRRNPRKRAALVSPLAARLPRHRPPSRHSSTREIRH